MYKFIKEQTDLHSVEGTRSRIEVTLNEFSGIDDIIEEFKNFLLASGFFWIEELSYVKHDCNKEEI